MVITAVYACTSGYIEYDFKENDAGFAVDGALIGTDTSVAVATAVDRIYFGTDYNGNTGRMLNGHLKYFAYYPQRLTNAELQAFSKQG